MKNLRNIKKVPFEIGQLLANNKRFCSFLIDDTNNPGEVSMSFVELLNEKYITIYPPVEDGAIEQYNRNTYAIILLDSISTADSNANIGVSGNIYITTDVNHILLTENRNRLLEMADEVLQTLDNAKLTSAGEIHINHISHTMITTFRAGYRISFTLSDQQIERAEI